MAAPSPIHRDPASDGDDYGCLGRYAGEGNEAVGKLVAETVHRLKTGEFVDAEEVAQHVRVELQQISKRYDCGSCDTIVKENVFAALQPLMAKSRLGEIQAVDLYGW